MPATTILALYFAAVNGYAAWTVYRLLHDRHKGTASRTPRPVWAFIAASAAAAFLMTRHATADIGEHMARALTADVMMATLAVPVLAAAAYFVCQEWLNLTPDAHEKP